MLQKRVAYTHTSYQVVYIKFHLVLKLMSNNKINSKEKLQEGLADTLPGSI